MFFFELQHTECGRQSSLGGGYLEETGTGGALGQPTSLPLALSFVSERAGLKIQFVPLVDIGNECQNQNNLFFGDAFFCSCLYPSLDEEAAQEPCCDHGHNVRKHVQWRTPKTKSSHRTARNCAILTQLKSGKKASEHNSVCRKFPTRCLSTIDEALMS